MTPAYNAGGHDIRLTPVRGYTRARKSGRSAIKRHAVRSFLHHPYSRNANFAPVLGWRSLGSPQAHPQPTAIALPREDTA